MQIALLSLGQNELETLYAIAVARKLVSEGHSPWLICGHDQEIALTEPEIRLLRLPERSKIMTAFRLWRWQRKIDQLQILGIGSRSVPVATLLKKMRKKDGAELNLYLPLPSATLPNGRELAKFRCCLYGSDFIKHSLEEILDRNKPSLSRPELLPAIPGIDICAYTPASGGWQPGRRFVFGMAASLEPDSGALLIIRAMAALWQHEDLPEWEVRMFGAGPRFAEIMTEASTLGVLSRLSLLADQPLPEVTGLCTIWLAPGSSPLCPPDTLWAGFAAGIPVIASANELHNEQISDSGAFLAIDGKNPQNVARAMLGLMRDEKLRAKLALSGAAERPWISLEGMAERVCGALNAA